MCNCPVYIMWTLIFKEPRTRAHIGILSLEKNKKQKTNEIQCHNLYKYCEECPNIVFIINSTNHKPMQIIWSSRGSKFCIEISLVVYPSRNTYNSPFCDISMKFYLMEYQFWSRIVLFKEGYRSLIFYTIFFCNFYERVEICK